MATYRAPLALPFLENLEVSPEWDAAARVCYVKAGRMKLSLEGQELNYV